MMRASSSKSELETEPEEAEDEEGRPISSSVLASATPGGGKAVLLLELFDCLGGLGAVIAGDRSVKVAPGFQVGLDLGDLVALGAVLRDGVDAGLIRRLGGGEGGGRHLIESKADDAEIDEHQNCQLNQVGGFFSGNHSIAP